MTNLVTSSQTVAGIQRLLISAWDSVVDNLARDPAQETVPLPTAPNLSYNFVGSLYKVQISVLAEKILTLYDVLQVLASAYDQMDEKLGWGPAVLHVYNQGVLVASGFIKDGRQRQNRSSWAIEAGRKRQ